MTTSYRVQLRRFAAAVLRHGLPWANSAVSIVGSVAGLSAIPLFVGVLQRSVAQGIALAGALLIGLTLIGSFRAWAEADERARSYESDTELKRGIAESIRFGRELRGRLRGAVDDDSVFEVGTETWSWSGLDVHQWLDSGVIADDLAREWEALMPGVHASGMEEFEAALGSLSRDRLMEYLNAGLSRLIAWQHRLSDT